MSTELNKYVRENLKKGVNPQALKFNLQAAGWTEKQIDDAFKRAKPVSPSAIIAGIAILVIVFIGTSFVFFLDSVTTPPGNGGEVTMESCDSLPNGEGKIGCYGERVRNTYNCQDIQDKSERLFCLRALELYYLEQV